MLVLQILKWILWIVLWILLVVLLIFLLVLLVPVRYRLEGEYSEKKKCFLGKISWCLSLVRITVHYEEALVSRVKILGITVYDSTRPRRSKKEKPKKKEKPEKRRKKEKKPDQKTGEDRKQLKDAEENAPRQPQVLKEDGDLTKDPIPKNEAVPGGRQALNEEAGFRQSKILVTEPESHRSLSESEPEQQKEAFSADSFLDSENDQSERKLGFWDKLKGIKQKFLGIIEKIKAIWKSVENKLDLIRYYYQLWKKEDTQTAWNKAKTRLGKSFVPFVPKKWTVTGIVGFNDPSTTGQMMAAIGMAYPIHGGNLIITPDFEESRMELKVTARGKITSGVILYHLLHILCDKDCRTLIKLLSAGRPSAPKEDAADTINTDDKTCENDKTNKK